ncbi:hypothetical protein PM082_019373 [Marasmius tenuissimus]|nr:hypothetical protein PM082_019269 [Marasmius tenuissimus]KAJ8075046.1 hypothetical protein PM082_019373 [Marasmius tenuissimus]
MTLIIFLDQIVGDLDFTISREPVPGSTSFPEREGSSACCGLFVLPSHIHNQVTVANRYSDSKFFLRPTMSPQSLNEMLEAKNRHEKQLREREGRLDRLTSKVKQLQKRQQTLAKRPKGAADAARDLEAQLAATEREKGELEPLVVADKKHFRDLSHEYNRAKWAADKAGKDEQGTSAGPSALAQSDASRTKSGMSSQEYDLIFDPNLTPDEDSEETTRVVKTSNDGKIAGRKRRALPVGGGQKKVCISGGIDEARNPSHEGSKRPKKAHPPPAPTATRRRTRATSRLDTPVDEAMDVPNNTTTSENVPQPFIQKKRRNVRSEEGLTVLPEGVSIDDFLAGSNPGKAESEMQPTEPTPGTAVDQNGPANLLNRGEAAPSSESVVGSQDALRARKEGDVEKEKQCPDGETSLRSTIPLLEDGMGNTETEGQKKETEGVTTRVNIPKAAEAGLMNRQVDLSEVGNSQQGSRDDETGEGGDGLRDGKPIKDAQVPTESPTSGETMNARMPNKGLSGNPRPASQMRQNSRCIQPVAGQSSKAARPPPTMERREDNDDDQNIALSTLDNSESDEGESDLFLSVHMD